MDEVEEFPFVKPEGSDAEMFIQWKGTDICMDFWCPCGAEMHFDGDFAYYVGCPACRTIYRMGTQVIVRKVEATDPGDRVKWMELDDDDYGRISIVGRSFGLNTASSESAVRHELVRSVRHVDLDI